MDLSKTIQAKSDQLNAEDLLGGPITITITEVKPTGNADQPAAFHYEGDNGKPYKPCKSMRKILVEAWTKETDTYVGRSITLFNDRTVTWAGMAVGGIRISALSHIKGAFSMSVKSSGKGYKQYRIEKIDHAPLSSRFDACQTKDDLQALWVSLTPAEQKQAIAFKDAAKERMGL